MHSTAYRCVVCSRDSKGECSKVGRKEGEFGEENMAGCMWWCRIETWNRRIWVQGVQSARAVIRTAMLELGSTVRNKHS